MEPRTISSLHNPVAQRFRKVIEGGRGRREGVFVLEGRHLMDEALGTGWPVEVLVVDRDLWPRMSGKLLRSLSPAALYLASRDLLARLGTVPSPEGILALCARREASLPEPSPGDLFLYLDRVQDPANVGTLLRSARAFGLAGVLCGPGTADPFGPTALARSAGGTLHLNPAQVTEEHLLKWADRTGVALVAADASGAPPRPEAIPGPRVLAVGNEGRGLSPTLRGAAAALVGLPMAAGWDSLNVAVAGSILMYLLSRDAGNLGGPGAFSATSPAL